MMSLPDIYDVDVLETLIKTKHKGVLVFPIDDRKRLCVGGTNRRKIILHGHMPMVVKRSKSKPEVELQDGGRLLSETGSSNISAVD